MGKDLEAVGERIAELAAHLDAATHRLLTEVRTFDEGGGYLAQGFRTCGEWLSWRVGWSVGAAREHVRVARRIAELPLIDDALRRGELSYSKVRAITRVATPANEATLLEDARFATGSQLEKICSKYAAVVRGAQDANELDDQQRRTIARTDLVDGMVRLTITLHPEEADLVMAAIHKVATERYRVERRTQPAGGAVESGATRIGEADSRAVAASSAPAETAGAVVTTEAGASAPVEARREADSRPSTTVATEGAADPTVAATDAAATDAAGAAIDAAAAATDAATAAIDAAAAATDAALAATDAAAGAAADASASSGPAAPARAHGSPRPAARAQPSFSRVDALVAMAQDVLRGTSPRRSPTELVVTVAAEVLLHPREAADPIGATGDGSCVSAETVRRLGCDCGVVHVHEDAHGNTLSVGRKTRSIPAALKRALLKRDRTCRFPGCANRLFLEGHHIEHWADGGATSLENLVATCDHHHRFLHEYGYRVELDADRQPRFFDRRGRLVPEVPLPVVPEDLGWDAIEAMNEELDISAETPACGWDGCRVDYSLVIDDLVRADRLQ